jgi:hypothetical protein
VARAKKTARADARRKYRAEQGLPPDLATSESAPDTSTTSRQSATPSGQPAGQRLSIGDAFRRSFTPLDVRGDLRALPWIATRTKALWLPALITLGATALFYVTIASQPPQTEQSQGSVLDLIARFGFAYFIQTPAIGGVFLAGFLAPRASWLLGVLIGLLSAVCYTFLILTLSAAVSASGSAMSPGAMQDVIISAFVLSPVLGAVFASAAAWYRRFLALSNPNRGRRQQAKAASNRPDGKSRSTQKAPVRR